MRSFCATVLITLLMPVLSGAQTNTQPTTQPQPAGSAQSTTPTPNGTDQTQPQPTTPPEPTTSKKPWWEIWKRQPKAPKAPTSPPEQAPTPATSEPEQTPSPPTTPPRPATTAEPIVGAPNSSESQGWTGYVQFQGSATSLGAVLTEALSLGYQLTPHLGFDAGVPLISTRSPFSPVTTSDWLWTTLLGEPWVDAHYTNTRSGVNFLSVLTGTIPPTNETRTYTTGRFNVDWFNHIEHTYDKFTPFLNLEASNGTINFYYMPRPYKEALPYQTLGFMSTAEAGGSYQFLGRFNLGASGYALVPAGPQKVYSRLVVPDSPLVGDGHHNRYFDAAFLTQGPHFIDEDYGFSGWVEVHGLRYVPSVGRFFDLQLGYTHSLRYHLDIYTVMINFNGTALFRKLTGTGQ